MKLNKAIKWCMVVLMLIAVGIAVWGFMKGFNSNDAQPVDVLLSYAYIMVGIAVAAWVIVGGIVSAKNNPKSLVKMGILLVAIAAVCYVAYLLAPANPAVGREGLDSVGKLKLTDTVLNLTYFAGVAAIVAIIVGEVRLAITNKK